MSTIAARLLMFGGMTVIGRLLGRWLIGCVVRLMIMVIVIGIGVFAVVQFAAAEALGPALPVPGTNDPTLLWAIELASATQCPAAAAARGVVWSHEVTLFVPDLVDAELLLSSAPDGSSPLEADDMLTVTFIQSGAIVFEITHDFRRADRWATEPFGPLNLTGQLPSGPVTVHVTLADLQPPLCGSTAIYLVARQHQSQAVTPSPTHDTLGPAQAGAALPTDTAVPPTATPTAQPTVTQISPTPTVEVHPVAVISPEVPERQPTISPAALERVASEHPLLTAASILLGLGLAFFLLRAVRRHLLRRFYHRVLLQLLSAFSEAAGRSRPPA